MEKNVYGYIMTTLEMCVLKDVRENGMVVKESHRTSLVGSPN